MPDLGLQNEEIARFLQLLPKKRRELYENAADLRRELRTWEEDIGLGLDRVVTREPQ
jgi:hypothetical protein